jgi:hypothetical protein
MYTLSLKNTTKLILLIFTICLLIVGIKYHKQIKRVIAYWVIYRNQDSTCKQCGVLFQDGLSAHESAYQYEGIKPKNDFDDLEKLVEKHRLIELETNENYIIEPMDASLPVLLPKGIAFINRLAQDYRTLCDRENIEYIPFRITSATRTQKSIKELRKQNGNAIENSTHLKGKTIDITYITHKKHVKQKELFLQALAKLKDQDLCYVKFEVQKKCLHITCR